MGRREPDDLAFIHQVGNALCQRGWRTPALILLDAGRPLAFLGGQLLWVLKPVLSIAGSPSDVNRLALLLERPEAVDALVEYLEFGRPGSKEPG
jgi:hypothetical protein